MMARKNYERGAGSSLTPRFSGEDRREVEAAKMKRMGKAAYYAAKGGGKAPRKAHRIKGEYQKKPVFDKKDYVPLSERDDWDGRVEVVRPYKDHEWTGKHFDSKVGQK